MTGTTKMMTSTIVCFLAMACAMADDSGFGDKLSAAPRGPRDVSSLTYGGPPPPPTGYGPPGHTGFPPVHHQQQQPGGFGPNRGQQSFQGQQFFQGQQQGVQPTAASYPGSHNQQQQHGHYQDRQWPPMPYEFAYSVLDAPSGNDYSHRESGDGSGRVSGEYRVLLPDGRTQIVTYTATDETGYNAQVTYQGEARPAPQGGFFGNQGGYRGGSNQGGAQGGFPVGGNQGNYQGSGFGGQKRPTASYGAPQPYRR